MLSNKDREWIAWLIIVALSVVSAVTGVKFPIQPPPTADVEAQLLAEGVTNLSGLKVAAPTTVATATPGTVIDSSGVSAIAEIRDAATPVARWENAGDLSLLLGTLNLSFANLTVSNGDWITPTYTVYALDTAGAVTITLGASASEGQLLVLINDDANATIVADTNVRTSTGGAITMAGAYDVTVWIYQDSEWLELLAIADS